MKKRVSTLNQTSMLAKNFAKMLKKGDVVVLNGDLGAGKTTFTQFVLRELGVKDIVNSPTFAIVKSYKGKFLFEHIDAYRINLDEAIAIGLDEMLGKKDHVFFIEWAQNIEPLIPRTRKTINIKYIDENTREFEIDE